MARSGDTGLTGVLRFYEGYRAYTRGKVEGMRLLQEQGRGAPAPDRAAAADRARRYFELAHRLVRPHSAVLLLTSGPMASGKSRLAASLARCLGGRLLRSDVVRKELAGLDPRESRREPWGEGLYAPAMTDRTYGELHDRARRLLRAGHVVVLDASYRERERRRAARAVASECDVPGLVLRVHCPQAVLRARLEGRDGSDEVSDGRLELLDSQLASWEPAEEIPPRDRIDLETTGPARAVARGALADVYRRLLAEARP